MGRDRFVTHPPLGSLHGPAAYRIMGLYREGKVVGEKLKDPNKPAHEIIEVLEDGDAIRNDGVRLTAANKNPWYVLATIYGEQEVGDFSYFGEELAARNRRAWNGWICAELSEDERKDRAEAVGLDPEDLAPLSKVEVTALREKLRARLKDDTVELPDPTQNINFSETYFPRLCNFEKYVFEKTAAFNFAAFSGSADFRAAVFRGPAYFISATFSGSSNFILATFYSSGSFSFAVFGGFASFCAAAFSGDAYFRSAAFNSLADFSSAAFSGDASFRSVVFSGDASFSWYEGPDGTKADHPVRFFKTADFNSTVFKSATRFTNVRFLTHVPEFHAAELYDDTVFAARDRDLENWPPLQGEGVMKAADQKRAYNRLRLFMNRSLQIDEEQFFHRMEMRCKRETESWKYKWIYTVFEEISDYGNSVLRPAKWLIVLWLSGTIAKLDSVKEGWWPDVCSIPSAMGWSFANLFSFFGFYRRYFKDDDLNGVLQVFSGTQTVLGFILLFFLGLGLRNRFRLR